MFCTRCGTAVEPVDRFCKNCGARLAQSSAPGSVSESSGTETERLVTPVEASRKPATVRTSAGNKRQVLSPAREHKGLGALFIGLGLAVVLIAASALYFGTDVLRESPKQEKPPSGRVAPPDSLPGDQAAQAGKAREDRLASAQKPPLPVPANPNNSLPEAASKSAPSSNAVAPPRKAPLQAKESAGGSGGAPASPASSGRAPFGGTYETTRSTPGFDSANVVANIPGGVRVDVVNAKGDWLEVHSKRGNPPGFIRRQDVTLLGKAN